MKESASTLAEYFQAMWANTRWNEGGTIFIMAGSYATLVSILLATSLNRLYEYSYAELTAAITWVVLFSLMHYQLKRTWNAYSQRLIELAHKNIFARGLLLDYVWDAIERNEQRTQVRRPADQLARPLRSRIPIRLIDLLERFVRDYGKLCDERGFPVIVDVSTRTWQQKAWLLAFYIATVLHIAWAVLEVYAAYGTFVAAALALLALFMGTAVGSHQTLQHLQLDVTVRRALLREFLGV